MSLFLALLVIGFVGMLLMSIPGLNSHGHAGIGSHVPPHLAHLPNTHTATPYGTHPAASNAPPTGSNASLTRFIPSPRMIFGFLALFGAFGNAFEKAGHLPTGVSALAALVPALLLERFALTPLWNKLMAFQGAPCAPLETLGMCEAKAVTPFRNGRGMVSLVYEGRLVQMRADLDPRTTRPARAGRRYAARRRRRRQGMSGSRFQSGRCWVSGVRC